MNEKVIHALLINKLNKIQKTSFKYFYLYFNYKIFIKIFI